MAKFQDLLSEDAVLVKPRLVFLVLCWAVFGGYVWQTAAQLPERVATHFGMDGAPNGWMTRAGHVRFTTLTGIGSSGFVLAVFGFIRWCGDAGLNIPNKEYWIAPERREATYEFVQRQGFLFACIVLGFIAGVHRTILVSNLRSPASLSGNDVAWLGGGFGGVTLVWLAVFVGRFFRKPA